MKGELSKNCSHMQSHGMNFDVRNMVFFLTQNFYGSSLVCNKDVEDKGILWSVGFEAEKDCIQCTLLCV